MTLTHYGKDVWLKMLAIAVILDVLVFCSALMHFLNQLIASRERRRADACNRGRNCDRCQRAATRERRRVDACHKGGNLDRWQ